MAKICVVGGGIGGLATAILLAQKGHEVTVFEKNRRFGGRSFVFKGFEAGPTLVLMPSVFDAFLKKIGSSFKELRPKKLSPSYTIFFPDGSTFSFDDKASMAKEIAIKFGEVEEKGFQRFLFDYGKLYGGAMRLFIRNSFTSLTQALPLLPHFLSFKPFSTAEQAMSNYFKNEKLRTCFTLQTVYLGLDAGKTPAPYAIIPFSEVKEGVWEFEKGFAGFVDFLERKAGKKGVRLLKGMEVDKILVDDGKATGVSVKGKKLFFDVVVCNADLAYANEKLFKGKKFSKKEHSCSAFLLFIKTRRRPTRLPKHSFFVSPDLKKNIHELFKLKKIPAEPSFYCHLQKKGAMVLAPVPDASSVKWNSESRRFAKRLLAMVKKRAGVEGRLVGFVSPLDFKSKVNAYHGSAFGLAPTLFQTAFFRPPVKSKEVENLFFVGASTQPGGGVPIVLISAELCASEVELSLGLLR